MGRRTFYVMAENQNIAPLWVSYVKGDILSVVPGGMFTSLTPSSEKFWFVHVDGVPDTIEIQTINDVLINQSGMSDGLDPHPLNFRDWCFDFTGFRTGFPLPQEWTDSLDANRYCVVPTMEEVFKHVWHKELNRNLDPVVDFA
jgi:hypothetical protein